MKKKLIFSLAGIVLLAFFVIQTTPAQQAGAPQIRHIPSELQKYVETTNYKDVRIKKIPISMQCWTFRRFTFFDTLAKLKDLGIKYVQAFPGQALGAEFPDAKFDHNMTDELQAKVKDKLKETGVSLVAYGVVGIGRTEESMRPVFNFARKMGIRTIQTEPEDDDFTLLEKLVKEYNIQIAIHNHPPKTKYYLPETVYDHVKGWDERIGSGADNGHWMRGMNDPREAFKLLEGRILDVHLKDRSDYGVGAGVDDVAWGQGKANIRDLLAELTLQDYNGFLTIEYENEKEVANPIPAIQKSVEYVKSITYYEGYEQIFRKSGGRYEKYGWNHYGPGYFEVDPKTGVLKGQGGMGLLWYGKKYKDFILECDFKCSTKETNSGIFIRVPEVPTSDAYIYHSFEIQVYDAGQGIHVTGAAYDVEAAKMNASLPTGEWNHFKIEFIGKHLKVELNGKLILDWDAKPGGKVKDYAFEGYIGLQNHDSVSPPYFRNIYVKEL
jgi:sugar phosphate isomerase/epimerase